MEPGYVLLVRTNQLPFPVAAVLTLLSACHGGEREPARTTAAAPPGEPTTASAAPSSPAGPASSGPAAPASDTAGIGAPKYPVCSGQGANASQLAPAFLDKMPACESGDTAPAGKLGELAGNGTIDEAKGDCEFAAGISCHFHTAMEFVSSTKSRDDGRALGEIHCIVPSSDANSPTVYGAHLRCKAGTSSASGTRACSKALLDVFDAPHCRSDWKCCDNGTLTKPVSKQSDAEKRLRPDFRICTDDAIEIDCGLLHGMRGHTANVAGVGEEVVGKFNAGGVDGGAH